MKYLLLALSLLSTRPIHCFEYAILGGALAGAVILNFCCRDRKVTPAATPPAIDVRLSPKTPNREFLLRYESMNERMGPQSTPQVELPEVQLPKQQGQQQLPEQKKQAVSDDEPEPPKKPKHRSLVDHMNRKTGALHQFVGKPLSEPLPRTIHDSAKYEREATRLIPSAQAQLDNSKYDYDRLSKMLHSD